MKAGELPQPEIRPTGRTVHGRTEFVLTDSFSLVLPLGRGTYTFHVPAGITTDFASIPRLLWCLISPLDQDILVASLIHDDLYSHAAAPYRIRSGDDVSEFGTLRRDRFLADAIFRTVMRMYGAPLWRRVAAYYAVRSCGWLAFHRGG